ncbi:MAG: PhzF family phenazine biosynthesis isomerase, partial [Sneathiellales bacterium]|nr:PhzF family phenazine biosynthesis isomerase [Sneathiellales bacterium]
MPNPYEYILTDVFADRIFGGNQLAVFPFARDFSDVSMAAISREFKLNETVFVTGEVPGGFTLRIFSPHGELPFAGHPLVGAASVLSSRLSDRDCARSFELHVPAGTVPVERVQNGGQPLFMIESPQLPCRLDQEIPISELASLLGLRENQISQSPDKAQAFSAGIPFFFFFLVDQRAVRQ